VRPPVFLAESAQLERDQIVLSGAEGRHAATVRRLSAGERADLTDGVGRIAECVVTSARPGAIELAVRSRRTEPAPEPRIAVVQAIPKGNRGEQAVEIMTEVGVDLMVPWSAERCVARWQRKRGDGGRGDRAARALVRWRAAAREAGKQSRRARFAEVTEPETTEAVAARCGKAALAILLDPDATVALASMELPSRGIILVIVGPEGGVSPGEADSLRGAGATAARLGPGTLRTSSAGAVAATLILSRCGRWG
jgi:16S rRNA (uracil1498-N3)-methyltransferase